MSPLNVALRSICISIVNVLKVCKSVASSYLTSYAAGKEEHAAVSINPDNTHNVLKLKMERWAVSKILARDAKQEKLRV